MATLVGAGVAGVVAHLTTRRTTLTTWRAKTAEWQYEALTAFYDAALDLREAPFPRGGDHNRLIAAWRRLKLTGPEDFGDLNLVKLAEPLYEAARELAHRDGLRRWRDFVEKIRAQQCDLARQVANQEIHNSLLMDAESAASSLYLLLHDAHAGVKKDWSEVRKAADAYDDAERWRLGTDSELGSTWRSISALLRSHGDPHEVQQERVAAQLRFDGAVDAFTSGMREWLNSGGARSPRRAWRTFRRRCSSTPDTSPGRSFTSTGSRTLL
ncbi:hypothetical protein ACF1AE_21200 [Streptomyces sp. NPDC014986]|uniref:hypothetical protein n=1 Tax=Streptomyces sp. NPDC014986 TaxID=3364934 RepID=UPI0036F5FF26